MDIMKESSKFRVKALAVAADEHRWYYVLFINRAYSLFGMKVWKKVYSTSFTFDRQTWDAHADGLQEEMDVLKEKYFRSIGY